MNSNQFQRLRVKNLHNFKSNKSRIDLWGVKLHHKVRSIYVWHGIFENPSQTQRICKGMLMFTFVNPLCSPYISKISYRSKILRTLSCNFTPHKYSISRLSSTRLLRVARSAKIRPEKSLRADSDCRLAGSRAGAKIDRVASWGSKAKFCIGHCTAQRVWRAHRPQTCCARWICPAKLPQKTCHKQPSRRTRNAVTSEV